ncbi:hypothetical protein CDAR_21301 [Caerostris darwini]|uniref:Uncharacterized protein n=1 Tax=Caerostris darwini TaxID=1538125 RepID=A0AAV4VZT9_9ARAC|nr:hypothetical protein CDAR_21301 [Caerostris darwini]
MLKLRVKEEIEHNLLVKYILRGRSQTKKPSRFDDYATKAESFIYEENPETYQEATESQEHRNCRNAMENEMTSMKENQTWELTELPKGFK